MNACKTCKRQGESRGARLSSCPLPFWGACHEAVEQGHVLVYQAMSERGAGKRVFTSLGKAVVTHKEHGKCVGSAGGGLVGAPGV